MKKTYLVKQLTALRKEQNLTQHELAEKCKMVQQTINKIENGYRMPRIDTLNRILIELSYELRIVPVKSFYLEEEKENE